MIAFPFLSPRHSSRLNLDMTVTHKIVSASRTQQTIAYCQSTNLSDTPLVFYRYLNAGYKKHQWWGRWHVRNVNAMNITFHCLPVHESWTCSHCSNDYSTRTHKNKRAYQANQSLFLPINVRCIARQLKLYLSKRSMMEKIRFIISVAPLYDVFF